LENFCFCDDTKCVSVIVLCRTLKFISYLENFSYLCVNSNKGTQRFTYILHIMYRNGATPISSAEMLCTYDYNKHIFNFNLLAI
jgi:hypothetical protein